MLEKRRFRNFLLLFLTGALLVISLFSLPSVQNILVGTANPLSAHKQPVSCFSLKEQEIPFAVVRESRGISLEEFIHRESRKAKEPGMFSITSACLPLSALSHTCTRFLYAAGLLPNSDILSRKIILSFEERQDGAKI